jgi:hypothetical protein
MDQGGRRDEVIGGIAVRELERLAPSRDLKIEGRLAQGEFLQSFLQPDVELNPEGMYLMRFGPVQSFSGQF